jgi:hypothetical protein
MNNLSRLLLLSLLLAVLQKAIALLLAIVALLVLYGMIFHPAHTLKLFAVMLMLSHPGWTVLLLTGASLVKVWCDSAAAEQVQLE